MINVFSVDQQITLLELQGQEIHKLQQDLKIKEESEISQIKDTLKKSVIAWKFLHSQIVKHFSEYQNTTSPQKSPQDGSQLPWIKEKLLNIIRFQVQMISIPSLLKKYQGEEQLEKVVRFREAVCQHLLNNMVKYRNISQLEKDGSDLSKFSYLEEETLKNSSDMCRENQLKDIKVDLYWLEIISMTPEQVRKSKTEIQADNQKALTMKLMMSMNNSKKSFNEYFDFALSFGNYYERYFTENESNDTRIDLLRNFGRLVCLFMKGFTIPGRPKIEDKRQTFTSLFKIFRFPQIIPQIAGILKDALRNKVLCSEFPEESVKTEMKVLIFNLYKIAIFSHFALEMDQPVYSDLIKCLFFLAWQTLSDFNFFRLARTVHLLMHKPSIVPNIENAHWAHQALFYFEIRMLLCNVAINLLKSAATDTDSQAKMAEKELLQLYRCLYCKPFFNCSYSF